MRCFHGDIFRQAMKNEQAKNRKKTRSKDYWHKLEVLKLIILPGYRDYNDSYPGVAPGYVLGCIPQHPTFLNINVSKSQGFRITYMA